MADRLILRGQVAVFRSAPAGEGLATESREVSLKPQTFFNQLFVLLQYLFPATVSSDLEWVGPWALRQSIAVITPPYVHVVGLT